MAGSANSPGFGSGLRVHTAEFESTTRRLETSNHRRILL